MESYEHKHGTAAAESRLRSNGFAVEAAPTITGYVPDAYGEKSDGNTVFKTVLEVETSGSITGQHAQDQMAAFASWAAKYSSRRAVLFVPAGFLAEARKELPSYDDYQTFQVP